MKPMKALLPLDDSDLSRQALKVAAQTLNPNLTEITLLRVTVEPQIPDGRPMSPAIHGAIRGPNDARVRSEPSRPPIYLDELKASLVADFKHSLAKDVKVLETKGFAVHVEIRFGDPAQEIVSEAQRGYNMIVMSTHGRSGIRRVLMGSVAEKVMRNVHLPVMMYHPEEKAASMPA